MKDYTFWAAVKNKSIICENKDKETLIAEADEIVSSYDLFLEEGEEISYYIVHYDDKYEEISKEERTITFHREKSDYEEHNTMWGL